MCRISFLAAIATLLAGALSTPAAATPGRFEASGSFAIGIEDAAILGGPSNVTKREFRTLCAIPTSQGLEAYVVQLPDALSNIAGDVRVEWAQPTPYNDIYMEFYGPDCAFIGAAGLYDGSDGTTEVGSFPAGTRYILISATTAALVEFTLIADPTQPGSGGSQDPDLSPSSEPPAVPAQGGGEITTTISTGRPTVRYGKPFTIQGLVTASEGCARPVAVEVSRRGYGQDQFVEISTREVSEDGSWSYMSVSDANASYIATPGDTTGCEGVVSSPVEVGVRAVIHARLPGSCVGVVRGRVVPASAGSRIILQERAHGVWAKVAGTELTSRSRFSFTPRECGRFRLWWKGSQQNLEAHKVFRLPH